MLSVEELADEEDDDDEEPVSPMELEGETT